MLEPGGPALGRVDAAIDAAIAEKRVVGAVVLIAYDGKVVHRRAAGLSNREARTPMSAERIFRLSSLTKPIVSARFQHRAPPVTGPHFRPPRPPAGRFRELFSHCQKSPAALLARRQKAWFSPAAFPQPCRIHPLFNRCRVAVNVRASPYRRSGSDRVHQGRG